MESVLMTHRLLRVGSSSVRTEATDDDGDDGRRSRSNTDHIITASRCSAISSSSRQKISITSKWMNSMIVIIVILLSVSISSCLSKPYSSKRLSYGESMDWNFGGWTPVSGEERSAGSGSGFRGISSGIPSSNPFTDPFMGSEYGTTMLQPVPIPSSSSSNPYSPFSASSSSSSSLNQSPRSNSPTSSSSNSAHATSRLALQHLTPILPHAASSLPSSSSASSSSGADVSNHNHNAEDSPESTILSLQQQSSSNDHVNVARQSNSEMKLSHFNSPSQMIQTRAFRYLDHNLNSLSPPAPTDSLTPAASSFRNHVPQSYLNPSLLQQPQQNHGIEYTIMEKGSLSPEQLASTGIKMEPKPLREAQMEAYKVIEQLEAQQDHLANVGKSGKPALLSPVQQLHNKIQQQQKQQQQHSYLSRLNQKSSPHKIPSLQSLSPYSFLPARDSRTKSRYNPFKSMLNNIAGGNNYLPNIQNEGTTKTIGLPVKEINNDYVTLPVAVETDSDKVLTQADIREIEKEVLKAIPETLGYGDKLPDSVYESALPIDPTIGPNGPKYETIELPPIVTSVHQGRQLNYGNNNNKPFLQGFMNNVRVPNFISALSPSKARISDILKPLLRKVKPPLPASPAQQLKGSGNNPDVPSIPSNAPYAGSHRPEDLDVVHFIAHQKNHRNNGLGNSPEPGAGQPVVYHVNQLMRAPARTFDPEKHKQKKLNNGNNNNGNNNKYPPPQSYQNLPNIFETPEHVQLFESLLQHFNAPNGQSNNRNQYSKPQQQQPPPQSNDHVTYEIIQDHSSAPAVGSGITKPPLDPYMTGNSGRPAPMSAVHFPASYGQSQTAAPQYQVAPAPQSYARPDNIPSYNQAVAGQSQHQQQQQPQNQPDYQSEDQYQNQQQSHGHQQQNQNQYIEVVNLPAGGGGQSVHYNPPSAYHPPQSYDPSADQGHHQNPNQQYHPGIGEDSGRPGAGMSYAPSQQQPSSGSSGVTLEYIDTNQQISNPAPVYSAPVSPSNPATTTSSEAAGASLASYAAELDRQSENHGSLSAGKEVVSLNGYKQTVSSLDPKTLVDLIAKQVPSLKHVLTGASEVPSSSSSSATGISKNNNAYEIIEMPPKYHASETHDDDHASRSRPDQSIQGYPSSSLGQQQPDSLTGHHEVNNNNNNNPNPPSTNEESYFIHHSSLSNDNNQYANPGDNDRDPASADYAAASSESAESTASAAANVPVASSGTPSDSSSSASPSSTSLSNADADDSIRNDHTSHTAGGHHDHGNDANASQEVDQSADKNNKDENNPPKTLIRNTDRYGGMEMMPNPQKTLIPNPHFGKYGQRIRGSESSSILSYSPSSSSSSDSDSDKESSSGGKSSSSEAGGSGDTGKEHDDNDDSDDHEIIEGSVSNPEPVKIRGTLEVSKIAIPNVASILLDQHNHHRIGKAAATASSSKNNNNKNKSKRRKKQQRHPENQDHQAPSSSSNSPSSSSTR